MTPGDVTSDGDIFIGNLEGYSYAMKFGVAFVTPDQAKEAQKFGWKVINTCNGHATIEKKE